MIDFADFDVRVTLSGGTAEEIAAEIETYKKEFPPEVYGTAVSQPEQFEGSPLFWAFGERCAVPLATVGNSDAGSA